MLYNIELRHGTYKTVISVNASEDDEAIAKARARAKRDGFFCLPMAYESTKILSKHEVE